MRPFLLASVLAAFASTSNETQAQSIYQPQSRVRPTASYYYAVPRHQVYTPGYSTYTYAAPTSTRQPNPTGYQNRPYYGAYGYGFSSNGSTDGFPPFRGRRNR